MSKPKPPATLKPVRVEPGQVWASNDSRRGENEFTITMVNEPEGFAVVTSNKSNARTTTVRIDRLFHDGTRGYTFLGY